MPKITNDETQVDQTTVAQASAKLKMLVDLFGASGRGEFLELTEAGIFGLTLVLNECAEVFDAIDDAVGAQNIARAAVERRVN
jgi:hypothetical protein